jgi:hypothetical protein
VEAGFAIFHEPTLGDAETIAVVDFDDGRDLEGVSAHQSRGVKIVAMASKADSLKIGPDEVARLSGILTYDPPPLCSRSFSFAPASGYSRITWRWGENWQRRLTTGLTLPISLLAKEKC